MIYNTEINKNESDIVKSSYLDNKSQKENTLSNNSDNSTHISNSNIPSFKKVLVTYDDTEKSDKAIKYSIYLSSISGAEITILQVLGNLDKLENSHMDVSNRGTSSNKITSSSSSTIDSEKGPNYSVNVEGQIIESMEDRIKAIENTGFKNKITYKIRTGWVVDEIVKEVNGSEYDLLIISSSHLRSWVKSLFSEARKIISNVDIPVLLLQ